MGMTWQWRGNSNDVIMMSNMILGMTWPRHENGNDMEVAITWQSHGNGNDMATFKANAMTWQIV
eukprot:356293-Chlamydomonas_euryale.AAC.3